MFLLMSVILLTGGCLPQCMLGADTPRADTLPSRALKQTTPLEQIPLEADIPLWKQTPPRSRHLPGADTNPEADTLPEADTPGSRPPEADTPLEADSGIRSMSGRYASYWNAFLFLKLVGIGVLSWGH